MIWQAVLVFLLLQAQPQPDTVSVKGSIEGTVVRAGSSDPIPDAMVMLITAVRETGREPTFSVRTDGSGRFSFTPLDSDTYRLGAAASGFLRTEYGQKFFPGQGTPIHLAAGQSLRNIVLSMTPTGAVSGRIRDENGQPLAGIPVQLMSYNYNESGERALRPTGVTETTNDRGEYRLFFVTPGRYYLSAGRTAVGELARSPNQLREPFPRVFHPGVADLRQATMIDVRRGEEQGGMDFTLGRQRFYRIQGRIVDTTTGGLPPSTTPRIRLRHYIAAYGTAPDVSTSSSGSYQDGVFEFRGVPPGSYMLTFAQDGLTGYLPVEVADGDVTGLLLRPTPGASIAGRWIRQDPKATANAYVQLKARDQGFLGAAAATFSARRADDAFLLNDIIPGEYRVIVGGLPEGFYVREARLGITDALSDFLRIDASSPKTLEIVVTTGAAAVTGAVRNSRQEPASGARLVLAPERHRERAELYLDAIADQNGRFNISGIAPGEYRIFAWESIEPNGWFDPENLKRAESRSRLLRLSENSRETVEVVASP